MTKYYESLPIRQRFPSMHDRVLWPEGAITEIPYRIYTDPAIFEQEMARIFCGESWAYVGLDVELPNPGDYIVSQIGNRSVVITRDEQGEVRGFANRCAHRGVKVCRQPSGNNRFFVCPYHQWSYDARGRLRGVPFVKGVNKQGGMPDDFDREDHNLPALAITTRGGVIFASFAEDPPNFSEYLGQTNRDYFDRVFNGRELTVLGYSRQLIPGNWNVPRNAHRFLPANLIEDGDELEALRIYGSLYYSPWLEALGYLRRAQLHERRGERDDALRYYGWFLQLWENADEHLQPQVESARRATDRLAGEVAD